MVHMLKGMPAGQFSILRPPTVRCWQRPCVNPL